MLLQGEGKCLPHQGQVVRPGGPPVCAENGVVHARGHPAEEEARQQKVPITIKLVMP
jgi:hypothetical protein